MPRCGDLTQVAVPLRPSGRFPSTVLEAGAPWQGLRTHPGWGRLLTQTFAIPRCSTTTRFTDRFQNISCDCRTLRPPNAYSTTTPTTARVPRSPQTINAHPPPSAPPARPLRKPRLADGEPPPVTWPRQDGVTRPGRRQCRKCGAGQR